MAVGEIWLNNDDAASAWYCRQRLAGCFNANGVFMGRAVVSHRIRMARHTSIMRRERTVNVPLSPLSGTRRHAQQPHPASRQADPDDRRVRGSFPISSTTTVRPAVSATVRRRAEGAGGCGVLKIGEGRGTLLKKGFPPPKAPPLPPKTFVFIESLFAGSAGTVLKEEGKRHQEVLRKYVFPKTRINKRTVAGKLRCPLPISRKSLGGGRGGAF